MKGRESIRTAMPKGVHMGCVWYGAGTGGCSKKRMTRTSKINLAERTHMEPMSNMKGGRKGRNEVQKGRSDI